jgi:periplasmic divalent cation tolerance protein
MSMRGPQLLLGCPASVNDGAGRPPHRLAPAIYNWAVSQSPIPTDFVVVLMTAPDADTGARIGSTLVEERLAACVNVIPGLRSIYLFEGKLCDEGEALCLLKTRRALYPALRDRVAALHPYKVPEILALPLADGNASYLEWLLGSTGPP